MVIGRSLIGVTCLALTAICSVGCGEGEPQVGVEPPPPAAGVPIRGTERLAWDQSAPSFQQLRQYGFTLYIDGTASALSEAECIESSTSAGFSCSSRLPPMSNGTHTIQLAAIVDGVESTRSSSLIVTMSQGRAIVSDTRFTTVNGTSSNVAAPSATSGGRLCIAADACFAAHREVMRPVPLAAPAALPDGRLLFVEGARDVRILAGATLLDEPALARGDDRLRIIALFVDPSFETTRFVRVAWIDESAQRRTVGVTRFRELDNRLGDAAVVIPGIPLPATGEPRLAQDDSGRIYVAVPAGAGISSGRAGDEGRLLRFSADGLAWSAGLGAPEFAPGFGEPDALTFDASRQRLWWAGRDRDGSAGLRSLAVGVAASQAPSSERVVSDDGPLHVRGRVMGLVSLEPARGAATQFLALDAAGKIWPTRADGTAASEGFTVRDEEVVGLSAGRNGTIYATTRSIRSLGPSFSIFRLDRQSR